MTFPVFRRLQGRPPPLIPKFWPNLFIFYTILFTSSRAADLSNDLKFTSNVYNATVVENAFGNTPVSSDQMMGMYLPDTSYSVRYRIVDGDPYNFFRSTHRVVGNFCFLEISVRTGNSRNLNRESRDHHTLKVKAVLRKPDRARTDIPGAVVDVNIRITDVNDLSPFFLESSYNVQLSEDTPLYASVIKIQAEDPDEGLNGEVYYSFKEPNSQFSLHPTSGVVSLTKPLQFHDAPQYSLIVVAQDRAYRENSISFPSEASLTIQIQEVNVYEPQIEVTKLEEGSPSGHLIILAIVNVIDNDRGPSGEIESLEIVEGDIDRVFRILPGSGSREFNLASLQTIRWEDAPYGYNLTLKAVDKGARPKIGYKVVGLQPPSTPSDNSLFTKKSYEVNVSESSPPGTHVVQICSWIPGTQTGVIFSISAGNEGGEFELDPTTGTLKTAMFLDAEMRDTYSLTVDASTSTYSNSNQHSARLIVKVLDANDNIPMIVAPQGIVQVEENQQALSFVVNVRAQDYDSDKNGHVSYSLADDSVPFSIDHFTGEVINSKQLDFETERRIWKLRVRASDWGEPYRRQTEKIITVKVLDVNDNRPQFEDSDCSGTVARSTPIGSEIMKVSAVDFDAGNIINYRDVGGNGDRCFSVDSNTGVIKLTCDLHDIIRERRTLNITASDGQHYSDVLSLNMQLVPHVSHTSRNKYVSFNCKSTGVMRILQRQKALAAANNKAEKEPAINILNSLPTSTNFHTPQFKRTPREIRLRENSEPGTVISRIKAHDPDSGYDGDILYAIASGNLESVFQIDMNSGELKVAGLLDRERVPRYSLNITVYDQGYPRRSSSMTLVVSLVDENDNDPKFEKPSYKFFMPESVINGTNVRQLRAHDPDDGLFGQIKYYLATDTRDFALHPTNGKLIVSRQLDFEKQSQYELKVIAEDGGARTTHTYVSIQVMNINDCAPEFPSSRGAEIRVPEDLPVWSLITLVTAVDPDSSFIRYSLESFYEDIFSLDPDSGALTLNSPLDYETKHAYNVSIRATDDGHPPLSSVTHLLILVIDVDENKHAPSFGKSVANASVFESSPLNTLVTSVPATDADLAPLDSAITYSLVGAEGRGIFYINQRGDIYTSSHLDRETQASYWLTVRAEDSGTVPRHSILHVYVEVKDVNDHRPLSDWAVYWPAVLENTPTNTLILTVQAQDPDPGTSLSYSISAGNPQSYFRINENTGEIRTTSRKLDRELDPEHTLEVTISDRHSPPSASLSSTTLVVVNVLDENDHSPTFLESVYRVIVPLYGALPEDNVIVPSTVEPFGSRDTLVQDLQEEDFIPLHTNFEDPERDFKNRIAEMTISKLESAEQLLTKDANDFEGSGFGMEMEIDSIPVTFSQEISSASDETFGIIAPEFTGANNKTLNRGIRPQTGNNLSAFRHHNSKSDGELIPSFTSTYALSTEVKRLENNLTGNRELRHRENRRRKRKMRRRGRKNRRRKHRRRHHKFREMNNLINVTGRHKRHIETKELDMTYELSGDSMEEVVQVVAYDKDSGDNGKLSYNIVPGNYSKLFKIHPISGVIYAPPNLHPGSSYELTVEARDDGLPPRFSRCHVEVTASPISSTSPNAPILHSNLITHVNVLETDKVGHLVTLVEVSDEDGDTLYFDIVEGNDGRAFSISRNKGAVIVAKPLDAEDTHQYTLTISVTDGVHIVTAKVVVSIVDMNDNRPRFSQPSYEVELSENTQPGTTVFTLDASDRDADNLLHYSLANCGHLITETKFSVNPTSGDVVLLEPLDREILKSHTLTINVKDRMTPIKTDLARLHIKVRDYNDHKPTFLVSQYNSTIEETLEVGSKVVQIVAVDHDSGANGLVTYSIVSGNTGGVFSLNPHTGVISVGRPLSRRDLPEYWLTVRAGDNGSPQHSAMVNVNIVIELSKESSPRFHQKEFVFEVSESARVGDSVGTLGVESRLGVIFSLLNPTKRAIKPFSVNPSTGILAVDAPLDYEVTQSYNLSVKALAMNGKESTCSVIINILDENDNSPMFSHNFYSGHISEAAAINSVVLQSGNSPLVISAKDKDSEQNSNLIFSILEEEAKSYFAIDSSTGAIRSVGPLDHEVLSSVRFSVSVRDTGTPTLSAAITASVEVHIDDINDVPPRFLQSDYNATLLLPTRKTVMVVQLNATDLDYDGSQPLLYQIADGNEDGVFDIDANTGLISVNKSEGISTSYKLKVIVYDGKFSSSTTVNIYTENLPQTSLKFSQEKYYAAVEENNESVDKVVLVQALGSQLNEHLKFKILNPSDMFTIGETSGVIMTSGKPFDREERNSYELVAEVRSMTPSSPRRISHVIVHVVVLDKNDNAPIFVNTPYYGVVPVDSKRDRVVFKVQATDFDADENKEVRYELRRGNSELFSINRMTGEVKLRRQLPTSKAEYELTVVGYDGGAPPLFSEATVKLKVVDKSQPIFSQQFYTADIAETADIHTPVLTVYAHSQLNRKIFYAIIAGPHHSTFAIEHEEGIIRVQEHLDFETIPSYLITVRAIDTVTGKYADVEASITVLDRNDHRPMFSKNFYNISVSEATAIATPILHIDTTDEDTGNSAKVSYRLEDSNGNLPENFFMESDSGVLILRKGLDREAEGSHLVKVVATDAGTIPLSSSVYVLVNVLDMNDNPPLFERPYYRCLVSQDVPRNHFVTLLSASDRDTSDVEHLIYSIVSGNEAQTFTIHANTGIVRVWNSQKLMDKGLHQLNISVTDGVFTSYTRLDIDISPVNNHSPVFEKDKYEAFVSEGLPAMTQVIQVFAHDSDSGSYGTFTYHFVGDEAHKYFRINENTGNIWTTSEFDREKVTSYSFTLMAVDTGGRSGFTTLHVVISDVNDNKPMFTQQKYSAIVASNASQYAIVTKIEATDSDTGSNGLVSYYFHSGTPTETLQLFSLNENTGEISIKNAGTELEPGDVFEFFVEARDGGGLGQKLSSVTVVLIRVVPSDTPVPVFLSNVYTIAAAENTTVGSEIGAVSARWPVGDLEYSVEWGDNEESPPLSVSPEGILTLNTILDYEDKRKISLVVTANPKELPELIATTIVIVEVQDINDEVPAFESIRYYISVGENVPSGSNILKVQAHDSDSGSNAEVRYHLHESSGHHLLESEPLFTLDPYSGWLSVNKKLDTDVKTTYILKAVVQDNGYPVLSSNCTIEIKVKDYNDNPPVFSKDLYEGSVREDSELGTVVVKIDVDDLDLNHEQQDSDSTSESIQRNSVQYFITSGNLRHQFHVRNSGEVYVNRPLDREDTSYYLLEITATDGTYVAQTKLKIIVTDVNDNPPICTIPYYYISVAEMAEVGTALLEVSAYDPDIVEKPRYFLSDSNSDHFIIDQVSGHISLARMLDRETQSSHSLLVTIRDGVENEWKCSCHVNIEILDDNDNPPVFRQQSFTVNVPENAPENRQLIKIHAIDADDGINRLISYDLRGEDIFQLDEITGILSVKEQLDREKRAMYNLTVTATDQGLPPRYSTASILVFVSDMNDNPPEFASHTYSTTIPESARIGTDVTRVLANSRDIGQNAEITYSIIGGNEHRKFTINPKTGVVSIQDVIDYERAQVYQLTIQATDGGHPPLSNQATVNVTVTDINDNPPVFITNSYSAVVSEDADIKERLVQVIATDQDEGKNSEISYSITRGDPHQQFYVDPVSGWVSVAGDLDRESTRSYTLEILALDHGIPQKSGLVMVNIDVSDVNDNPPVFEDVNDVLYLQDDKAINYMLHRFRVTDRDDGDGDEASYGNGRPFIFEIRSGNVNNAFRITENGELRTATRFNHKIRSQYRLQIGVYDNGDSPLYTDIWIDIKIIEESQYPPVVLPLQITMFVQPDQYTGGNLGRVQASDQDPYDVLTYQITPNSHNARYFAIDRTKGKFKSKGRLDEGIYSVNVTVSDGKFISFGHITVEMVDVSDEMLKNAVIIRFAGASPENFVLSHRRVFHRSIRSILNVKSRDIIILGIQKVPARHRRNSGKRNMQSLMSSIEEEIDVLFVVKKGSAGFLPRNFVRKRVMSEIDNIERSMRLRIVKVAENECQKTICANGYCEDQIILDDDQVVISANTMSFVSLKHHHNGVCICPPGFAGPICDKVINKCAYQPCPSYKECKPNLSSLGYSCECPEGLVGATCSQSKASCVGRENSPSCYMSRSPLSFKGKSFAHYQLHVPIERHFSFSIWFRTLYSAGNIMFTSGRLDYGALELSEGRAVYRWDLGSGMGYLKVLSPPLNDSQWHHVFLERIGNTVRVSVDNVFKNEASSPGSNEMMNLETPDLYLGAEIRSWLASNDPQYGFVGCLDDPRVYDSQLPVTMTTSATATLIRLTQVTQHCYEPLVSPGVCGSQPCANGGTCIGKESFFQCRCLSRFTGRRCEIDSDPCASSPCLNNGRCTNVGESYICHCPQKISGKRCEHKYCHENPCLNGGVCEEGISGPVCKCRGFVGLNCDIDINECEKSPCDEGVLCINTLGGYRCDCPPDVPGLNCTPKDLPSVFFYHKAIFVIGGVLLLLLLLMVILLTIYCVRRRRHNRQEPACDPNEMPLKPKTHDQGTLYRPSKLGDQDDAMPHSSFLPHGLHPDPLYSSHHRFPSRGGSGGSPEPVYMPLNNFDTIPSYSPSPKHDVLVSHHNITKPSLCQHNTLPHHSSLATTSPKAVGGEGTGKKVPGMGVRTLPPGIVPPSSADSQIYKKQNLGHNLKEAYYEGGKIPNDGKFSGGGYKLCSKDTSPADDVSLRSCTSGDEMPGYHWDCSDWARSSQNPLPNIVEVPGSELPDALSYHSNESNESIPQQETHNVHPAKPSVVKPVNPERDMDTLAVDDMTSDCGTDFELDSRPDLEPSHNIAESCLDLGNESDTSLFVPQPHKYKCHPNQYLPRYHAGSETEAEEERTKLLNNDPSSPKTSHSFIRSPPPSSSSPLNVGSSPSARSPNYRSAFRPSNLYRPSVLSPNNRSQASAFPRTSARQSPKSSKSPSDAPQPLRSPSSYVVRNNRRYAGGDQAPADLTKTRVPSGCNGDEFEVMSLCGNTTNTENLNTSASDLENVCEIEDSEINSEFEN